MRREWSRMRVALIHDWLVTMGGAEKVLEEMAEMFPDAPIYTGVVNRDKLSPLLQTRTIIPSFVQSFPRATRWYNRYLPFLMYGFEQFDLSSFDLVISSSASVAKGVVTRAETRHISYVHTPMRYAWDLYHDYRAEQKGLTRWAMGPIFHYARIWDRLSSDRVDRLIANSTTVARRVQKHYRRTAEIIFPPVNVDRFQVSRSDEYFLVLSRLVPYKRIDLAIEASNRLGFRLLVGGDGPELARLKRMAGKTVEFFGRVSDRDLPNLMAKSRALLFPGEEDFGIVPVEAQAAGTPVIAFGKGGITDTVIPGRTGEFFDTQSIESLIAAIRRFESRSWDVGLIKENAQRFRPEVFRMRFRHVVEQEMAEIHQKPLLGDNPS